MKKRYKVYLFCAIILCATGVLFNIAQNSSTGTGTIFICTGGILLVLGITMKKKSDENQ